MQNYYQLALEEFLTKPNQRVNGRRVTDVTEHERKVILARASELARRSTLTSCSRTNQGTSATR